MPNMHQTEGFSASPTHAAPGHRQLPMAGDHSQLLQSQRQRVPPHLQSFQ